MDEYFEKSKLWIAYLFVFISILSMSSLIYKIIPVHSGPRMLMTRNLLYTAVTRARTCVCLVGLPDTFHAMAANQIEQKRYSGLQDRICELAAL